LGWLVIWPITLSPMAPKWTPGPLLELDEFWLSQSVACVM
jgi:hypothetical protein